MLAVSSCCRSVHAAAGADVSWPQAVRPGDILRTVTTIENVRRSNSKPDRGFVMALIETFNQNDEVVQRNRVRMLAFARTNDYVEQLGP